MLRKNVSDRYEDTVAGHQLAEARQAFEEFAYIVAHDLTAPLRSILNFSQLLEDRCGDVLDEKALHYVDLITENSRKAQARIAGLLQYSRLDTVPLRLEPVDCNVLVEECLWQLKNDIEECADISTHSLPHITADAQRLGLLFYCLLSNAFKFNSGKPAVDISAHREQQSWIFTVRDNGIGIAPKNHKAIFDVFHRLHKEEEYPGCGMGLALAQRIARLHGGAVWVESELDHGSAFFFSLPDAFHSGRID